MIRRPPRSTLSSSSAASDVYKRQVYSGVSCALLYRDSVRHSELLSACLRDFAQFLLPPTRASSPARRPLRNSLVGRPLPRRRESMPPPTWIPVFTGMTEKFTSTLIEIHWNYSEVSESGNLFSSLPDFLVPCFRRPLRNHGVILGYPKKGTLLVIPVKTGIYFLVYRTP